MACASALVRREDGIVGGPGPPPESGALVVGKRLLDLGARVHNKGTVLDHRFADWTSLQEKQLALFRTVVDGDFGIGAQLHHRATRNCTISDGQGAAAEAVESSTGAGHDRGYCPAGF